MSKYVVSKRIYEMLIDHLTKIKEEKNFVIEKYYPVWTDERSDFQELMDSYIEGIDSILSYEVKVSDNGSDDCPFVIIGCQMILKDSYTNLTEEMQIVSPFNNGMDYSSDSASYLSPMGRSFLLKKVKDLVKVETPMGIFEYTIESIKLPSDILQYT